MADRGDTTTIHEMLDHAKDTIRSVAEERKRRNRLMPLREIVADKGYHSNDTLRALHEDHGLTTCISKPDRGRRKWKDEAAEQKAVYKNRQRIRSKKGIAHRKWRGEIIERSFAHCYDTGAMRRTHLREHENILKRLLIHVGAFNLSLIFRQAIGAGTLRRLRDTIKTGSKEFAAASQRAIRAITGLLQSPATTIGIPTSRWMHPSGSDSPKPCSLPKTEWGLLPRAAKESKSVSASRFIRLISNAVNVAIRNSSA